MYIPKYALFLFLLFSVPLFGQNEALLKVVEYELDGKWIGTLSQDNEKNALATKYTFEVQIKANGRKLSGTSYISVGNNHAKIKFKGQRNGLQVKLTEYEVVSSSIKDQYTWCIKNMQLEFGFHQGAYTLKGPWDGKSSFGQCAPGKIKLTKETIRA